MRFRDGCQLRFIGCIAFSSLFIGMGFAIKLDYLDLLPCERLSVPFSSGWALRYQITTSRATWLLIFQFPFHRDGLCDSTWLKRRAGGLHFQFPFHRDGLCDQWQKMFGTNGLGLAFSSLFIGMGFAIIISRAMKAANAFSFSSLFIGMGFAISLLRAITFQIGFIFQFPFHRDGLCDLPAPSNYLPDWVYLSVPFSSGWALRFSRDGPYPVDGQFSFSSLFIGMGFAIERAVRDSPSPILLFQFPFHRDGLCDHPSKRDDHEHRQLSVPFSSGWALRLNHSLTTTHFPRDFQFPFHRDGLCDFRTVSDSSRKPGTFSSLFIGMGFAI